MTLTHTVQSFAHDASRAANDLGAHAADLGSNLGSKAAEIGSDAAATVAAAATNLAHTISKKVPGVPVKKSRSPWKLIGVIGLGAGAALLFARRRRSAPTAASAVRTDRAPDVSGESKEKSNRSATLDSPSTDRVSNGSSPKNGVSATANGTKNESTTASGTDGKDVSEPDSLTAPN